MKTAIGIILTVTDNDDMIIKFDYRRKIVDTPINNSAMQDSETKYRSEAITLTHYDLSDSTQKNMYEMTVESLKKATEIAKRIECLA